MIDNYSEAIRIIVAILAIITLIFLIIAAFSDPGMIFRRPLKGQIELCRRPVLINQAGLLRTYRFCGTCSIIRPNRSTHCGDCNNCVERFDHHCPWIGNCAGRRNYVYFFIFLVFLNVLTVFMGIFCIVHIALYVKEKTNPVSNLENKTKISAEALCDCVFSLFILIYCALSMLFTTGLLIYHLKLISHNITTKEELKKFFANPFGNPFERAFCFNWRQVLCPKLRKMSILDYFKSCKMNKNIIVTEEKKALKGNNREMIVLDDKDQLKAIEQTIESQFSTNKNNVNNNNGMPHNNSDNTSIAEKKNEEHFRESKEFQKEIKIGNINKSHTSIISEKYSDCSENISNMSNEMKVIPSLDCQIQFQHSNETRENLNMTSNNNKALSRHDSKIGIKEHLQIQANKIKEHNSDTSNV